MKGVKNVMNNLHEQRRQVNDEVMAGLYKGGLLIQRRAQQRTPVDTGNLRASAYTRRGDNETVEVGYTADYAVFVHEDLEAEHVTGQAKFLETAVNDSEAEVMEILRRTGKPE